MHSQSREYLIGGWQEKLYKEMRHREKQVSGQWQKKFYMELKYRRKQPYMKSKG